ncbi:GrpB family protein [Macrococcoides caseolyticum subsp. caseolyticum]|uniref:GrpB family protein n=1 Tax=Macrococcoides caseolyticum TaxID=69966 RepID=UPI000CD281E4|nr:GrpB family protein [Macrococcus caseolyticus]PNZ75145.1 GrpB family protein [Macrococcus caseolyticus]QPT46174.1 GrpB family protein [Macrococcus caseolyticus]RAK45367.1 GrpB family protein [Macrococcus caseolyticus subsp. caseolyticus]HCD19164.1 GrpB family protein [Macrococcus caseolyticus]
MKQVMIVPYDSIWQHLYIGEKKRVLQKLKNISGIHHIGSTAVPGMDARATIDIAVEVKRDIEALELAELGYYLICQEQRYKVYATKDHQFHLFVYNEADEELLKSIKLRDYFRTFSSERDRYSTFKWELARIYPFDFSSYKRARDIFLTVVEVKAMNWNELSEIQKLG